MANIYDIEQGQVVFSKSGRDRGHPFIVVATEGNFLWLADGRLRKAAHPKKKKRMHTQVTKIVCCGVKKKLLQGKNVTDAELRKALEACSKT